MTKPSSSSESLKDLAASEAWAKKFASRLKRPCVVLLSGDLGAGKTQFVRWFLQSLKVDDIASPTFAIHHEYSSSAGPIDHIDLYRVESDADLEATGFWDLLLREDALMFVEWADRLPSDIWPSTWRKVSLHLAKDGEDSEARVVTVSSL